MNGGATLDSTGILLTDDNLNEARSAFGTSGFPVTANFSTTFDYQATYTGTAGTSADQGNGFSFVLQSNTPTAVGGGGRTGLGYTGITNSLAISFNAFNNVTQSGIAINGGAPSLADMSTSTGGGGTFGNAFHVLSGTGTVQTDIFQITLAFNSLTNSLQEIVLDTGSAASGGSGTHTYTANFPMSAHGGSVGAVLGNGGAYAYAGFTGSTDTAANTDKSQQYITNWNFTAASAAAAPALSGTTFSDGHDANTTQRSIVRQVIFNFSSAVTTFPLQRDHPRDARYTGGSGNSAPGFNGNPNTVTGVSFASTTQPGGTLDLTNTTFLTPTGGSGSPRRRRHDDFE